MYSFLGADGSVDAAGALNIIIYSLHLALSVTAEKRV